MTHTSEGTLIKVLVKPKAKNLMIKPEEENLLMFCRNAPEKGKVNREMMKELQKLLKREVVIISGFASREKIVLVKDTKPEELARLLSQLVL